MPGVVLFGVVESVEPSRGRVMMDVTGLVMPFFPFSDSLRRADLTQRYRVGTRVVCLRLAGHLDCVTPCDEMAHGRARVSGYHGKTNAFGKSVTSDHRLYLFGYHLFGLSTGDDISNVLKFGDEFRFRAVPQASYRQYRVIQIETLPDAKPESTAACGGGTRAIEPQTEPTPPVSAEATDDDVETFSLLDITPAPSVLCTSSTGERNTTVDDNSVQPPSLADILMGRAGVNGQGRAECLRGRADRGTQTEVCAEVQRGVVFSAECLRGRRDWAVQTEAWVCVDEKAVEMTRCMLVDEGLISYINYKYPQVGAALFPP